MERRWWGFNTPLAGQKKTDGVGTGKRKGLMLLEVNTETSGHLRDAGMDKGF